MASELTRLREFAAWVMASHTESIEGCYIERKAVELDLMDLVPVTEACGEGCNCADYGFPATCYRPRYPAPPPAAGGET